MIEIFVFIILIIFILVILSSFIAEVSLFINLVLLGLMLILISTDLKKIELQKYYLISLFLTAIIFILSNVKPIQIFLGFFTKASLSLFITAFILIYAISHILRLADKGITNLVEKYQK